jgi:hypothetical protein
MKTNVVIGSALAAALMSVGVLAGSIIGNGSAAAQTPSATATATSTPRDATTPADPPAGIPGGMGGRGHGRGDFGGDRGFMGATADGASQAITSATDIIALVKTDLAYAAGKMDTADVEKWLDGADALLASAQNANASSQYGQASAYASAARELAMAARSVMAQELGAETLPSYSELPQRPDRDTSTATAITQAQASRILAETYNHLVAQEAVISNATNASEATPYLTDAQDAYGAAYDAYQVGSYDDAIASARLAGKLAHVAESVARASTAPANADTPVTVPAPNF